MAYVEDIYKFPDSIEHEYKYAGNYGAKGEKRHKRQKATPEQIKKQNQRNKEKYVRRLLKLNFRLGDYWVTLLYPAGTRKSIEEVRADIKKLDDDLRYRYRVWWKSQYKYIKRIEIGANGGIHCHMIVNQVKGFDVEMEIQKLWNEITGGRAHFERYHGNEESSHKVADYLVKPLTDNQVKRLEEHENITEHDLVKYMPSRNLIKPVRERKYFKRRTLRALLEAEEPKATSGYYIDKSSIVSGVNEYTGLSYLYYTEIKIDSGGGKT